MVMTETRSDEVAASLKQVSTNLPNIQGNVFGGFFKDHQVFLFLRINDTDRAKGQSCEPVAVLFGVHEAGEGAKARVLPAGV